MRPRRVSTLIAVGLFVTAPLGASAVAASTQATVAPGTFSTSPRVVQRSPNPAPLVTSIRVGHHTTYDRVVIEFKGAHAPGLSVRYVPKLYADPSGKVVNLLGPASIQFVTTTTSGHDPNTGNPTLTTPKDTKWRLDQVRETDVIGDFEGVFTVGVGLDHKTPFRVLTLYHPTRIVLDVHH